MARKVKVQVYGAQAKKTAMLEDGATVGASFPGTLVNQAGVAWTIASLAAALGVGSSSGGGSESIPLARTIWRLIQEVPIYTTGTVSPNWAYTLDGAVVGNVGVAAAADGITTGSLAGDIVIQPTAGRVYTRSQVVINPDGLEIPANAVNADAKLVLVDNGAISIQQLVIAAAPSSLGYRFVASGGTPSVPTAVNTADIAYLGFIGGGGYDGTAWQTGSAGLVGIRPVATWTSAQRPTRVTIETTALASTARVAVASFDNAEIDFTTTLVDINSSVDLDSTSGAIALDVGGGYVQITGSSSSGTIALLVENALPRIAWNETGVAADSGLWYAYADATVWNLAAVNDARSTLRNAIQVNRSGNALTQIALGNVTDDAPIVMNGALNLSNTIDALITNIATPAIYSAGGLGSGDFALAGTLFIQPRSSAARDIIFLTGSTSPTERLRITGSNGQLLVGDGSSSLPVLSFASDPNTGIYHTANADEFAFVAGGSHQMIVGSNTILIAHSASVGPIAGITTPRLQITGGVASTSAQANARFSNDAAGPSILLAKSRGSSIGTYTIVQSGDVLGTIVFAGADGTDLNTATASIRGMAFGTIAADTMPSQLQFLTGTAATQTVRWTIAPDGQLFNGTAITAPLTVLTLVPWLQAASSTSEIASLAAINLGNNTQPGRVILGKARNVNGTTTVNNGDSVGRISFAAADGGDMASEVARIDAIVNGTVAADTLPTDLVFYTTTTNSPTERLRISSVGNAFMQTAGSAFVVGHSSSLASGGLEAYGTGAGSFGTFGRFSASASQPPTLQLLKSRNTTVGSHTIVQSGDAVGRVTGFGSDGASYINAGAIEFVIDGTPGTNDMPGRIVFYTTADGSASLTDRGRIDSTGAWYITKTTSSTTLPPLRIGTTTATGAACDFSIVQAGSVRQHLYNSSDGTEFMLVAATTGVIGMRSNHNFELWTNNAQRVVISNTGAGFLGCLEVGGSHSTQLGTARAFLSYQSGYAFHGGLTSGGSPAPVMIYADTHIALQSGLTNAANDAAAAAAGVAVTELYRNGSVVMIRVA